VPFKVPESVLVVIHTPDLQTLLLERIDHPGFWQSVTGSLADPNEPLRSACAREVEEETGWRAAQADFDDWAIEHEYSIFPQWRHRYAAGVTHNREHVFALRVAQRFDVRLAAREHTGWRWLGWREAADACFSWTNAQAIRMLPERAEFSSPTLDAGEGPTATEEPLSPGKRANSPTLGAGEGRPTATEELASPAKRQSSPTLGGGERRPTATEELPSPAKRERGRG